VEKIELARLLEQFKAKVARMESGRTGEIKDLNEAIVAMSDPDIGNRFLGAIFEKACKFLEAISNPAVCWNYMDGLHGRAEPKIAELRHCFAVKAARLISAVSEKETPEWFLELAKNPENIHHGFRELFRKKVNELLSALEGKNVSDEGFLRTSGTQNN